MSAGEIDPEYLFDNDLEGEEFREAQTKLIDRAYRKVTEWRTAVRQERPVEEVNDLARESAKTAYTIDRLNSGYVDRYGKLTDPDVEIVNEARRAWRFVHESGTQMQYEGKNSEDFDEGDFVLINGNNVGLRPNEFDEMLTYKPPSNYIEELSGPIRISSFEVDPDASLDDINRDDFIEL